MFDIIIIVYSTACLCKCIVSCVCSLPIALVILVYLVAGFSRNLFQLHALLTLPLDKVRHTSVAWARLW